MNILIHSNNIYFNIGIAQCFRDIQKTAPELKVIHSLPLSHLPELSGLDVIILSLENYHDYWLPLKSLSTFRAWSSALRQPAT